jgi:hypothetical protein
VALAERPSASAQLDYANRRSAEIRQARSELRSEVRAGRVDPRDVLWYGPAFMDAVRLGAFLLWVPAVGPGKAYAIMRRAQIFATETLTLGKMTDRQREAVIALLPKRPSA